MEEELEILKEIYLNELTVSWTENGQLSELCLLLHPATAGQEHLQYTCLTLAFTATPQYPDVTPTFTFRNPRGISEEMVRRLEEELRLMAADRLGEMMLYDLIEHVKDSLTADNVPHGACPVCLDDFDDQGSKFVRTPCYHYFHSSCLARYARFEKAKFDRGLEEGRALVRTPTFELVCPVCRLPLPDACWAPLLLLPEPLHAPADPPPPQQLSPVARAQREQLQRVYEQQLQAGGIIDLELESRKHDLDPNWVAPEHLFAAKQEDEAGEESLKSERRRGRGQRGQQARGSGGCREDRRQARENKGCREDKGREGCRDDRREAHDHEQDADRRQRLKDEWFRRKRDDRNRRERPSKREERKGSGSQPEKTDNRVGVDRKENRGFQSERTGSIVYPEARTNGEEKSEDTADKSRDAERKCDVTSGERQAATSANSAAGRKGEVCTDEPAASGRQNCISASSCNLFSKDRERPRGRGKGRGDWSKESGGTREKRPAQQLYRAGDGAVRRGRGRGGELLSGAETRQARGRPRAKGRGFGARQHEATDDAPGAAIQKATDSPVISSVVDDSTGPSAPPGFESGPLSGSSGKRIGPPPGFLGSAREMVDAGTPLQAS